MKCSEPDVTSTSCILMVCLVALEVWSCINVWFFGVMTMVISIQKTTSVCVCVHARIWIKTERQDPHRIGASLSSASLSVCVHVWVRVCSVETTFSKWEVENAHGTYAHSLGLHLNLNFSVGWWLQPASQVTIRNIDSMKQLNRISWMVIKIALCFNFLRHGSDGYIWNFHHLK